MLVDVLIMLNTKLMQLLLCFSSQQPRASSSVVTLNSQAAGSSLYHRPTGPRGISHVQSEPVFSQQRVQPHQAQWNQPQRSQIPSQHWQSQQRWSGAAQPQQLRHPPSQTVAAFRNSHRSDGFAFAQSASASTAMRGSCGGRPGQHVTARLPVRSAAKTSEIRTQLLDVFPDKAEQVDSVLKQNQDISDVNELCLRVAKIV